MPVFRLFFDCLAQEQYSRLVSSLITGRGSTNICRESHSLPGPATGLERGWNGLIALLQPHRASKYGLRRKPV